MRSVCLAFLVRSQRSMLAVLVSNDLRQRRQAFNRSAITLWLTSAQLHSAHRSSERNRSAPESSWELINACFLAIVD